VLDLQSRMRPTALRSNTFHPPLGGSLCPLIPLRKLLARRMRFPRMEVCCAITQHKGDPGAVPLADSPGWLVAGGLVAFGVAPVASQIP